MRKLITDTNRTILRHAAATVAKLATGIRVERTLGNMLNLLLAGMVSLFCCSVGRAQMIYSNAFNGGASSINVKTPTMSTNYAGATSSAWWNVVSNSATSYIYANGTVGTGLTSALLPFTPEDGFVYTLTASVTVPTMTAGQWITMGFAEYNPLLNTAPDPRFGSTYVNGNPWTYLTEGSGGDFFYPLRATTTGNTNLMPTAGTYTVELVLDTTASQWEASEYVNGTQVGTTYTYSSNPSITAIGIGQTTLSSSTGIQWNYLTLQATGTRTTNTVSATVSFSGTGSPFNANFAGLSYEKLQMTNNFFTSNNVALVNLFSLMGPTVLRIAGGTVDTTGWGGISNTIPITSSEVDALAGFINALPGNVSVIYGIDYLHNTADNVEAEAVYAHNALGSNLLGFEIGNEPEYYGTSFSTFIGRWRILAAAITNHVAGWAIINGGNGWILDGADAGQGQLTAYTDPFASDEPGVASLLSQHFYGAGGGLPTDTMQTMLQPNTTLVALATNIAGAAAGKQTLGARVSECGSFSAGGTLGVSDVYGAALWSLDFMSTLAVNGGRGVNFHGGGKSPYSPLNDNGTTVTAVGPEFYGVEMFSFIPPGNAVPATISPSPSINFTAYGVKSTTGGTSAILNNKEVNTTVTATVNLGSGVASAAMVELTSPNLYCTTNYTLGGASINTDGTWTGGVQSILSTSSGQLTVSVPPISAVLLVPITVGSKPAVVTSGPIFNLREDLTTGPADFSYGYGSNTDTTFVMGDWTGSGTMSPGIVRTNSIGQLVWYLRNENSSGTNDIPAFAYGHAGDIPIVGDWDGNGTWTPGHITTNTSGQLVWYLRNENTGGGDDVSFTFGNMGDTPVVGDWDGNGTFTPGVIKAGSNTWELRNENTTGSADLTFGYGNGTGIPIVGDWDGNGTWTPGVISGNTWSLRNENSSGNADLVFSYGSTGDKFLVWK